MIVLRQVLTLNCFIMAGDLILPLASWRECLYFPLPLARKFCGVQHYIPNKVLGCQVASRNSWQGAWSTPGKKCGVPGHIPKILAGRQVGSSVFWRGAKMSDNGPANIQLWYGMDRSEQACLSYGSEGVKHVWRTGRDWRSFWHTGGRFGIREGSFWHTGRAGLAYGRATAPRTASVRESQP